MGKGKGDVYRQIFAYGALGKGHKCLKIVVFPYGESSECLGEGPARGLRGPPGPPKGRVFIVGKECKAVLMNVIYCK